jgi:predicted transcriptional regulator
MKNKSLGELEVSVLNIIWEHPQKSVKELHELICKTEKQVARTTVLTIIQRLESKGYLKRDESQKVATYTTTKRKELVLKDLADKFIRNMLGGSVKPAMQSFLDHNPTSKEIAEMEALIEQYKNKGYL